MDNPIDLSAVKAKQFLKELADEPFVALVFDEAHVKIYTKGLDEEKMQQVADLLEQITNSRS